ncbi:hypothetical protein ABT147_11550 [Streptomyces sp. NPDC001868]|uniref:hypothetical protein n=1 Tax=Streptomyces sp. NPDC001868 TaxID=3154401 RepID=UPI003321B465
MGPVVGAQSGAWGVDSGPVAPLLRPTQPLAPTPVGGAAPADDGTSGADLILPVAAAGTAVAVAAYSLVRRRRRARLRTTPTGTFEPPTTPLPDLHRRAQRLLVETDDSVRTSTEELRFAAPRPGRGAAEADRDDTETRPEGAAGRDGAEVSAAGSADDGAPATPPAPEATQPPTETPAGSEDTRATTADPTDRGTAETPPTHEATRPSTDTPASPDDAQAPAAGPTDRDDVQAPDAGPTDREGAKAHAAGAGPVSSRPERAGGLDPGRLDPGKPFVETPAARDAVRPFVEALADARGELVVACRAGLRLDEERDTLSPDEERALLEEILTRCTTAQRRLDTATPAFDQLRALERDITPALEYAETRFRELTGRTSTASTTLTALRDSYAPAASLPVTGHVEQAKDRLVFATTELNRARQAAYPGDLDTAAVHLRAAEGAIHQADLFVTGVERLAAELAHATATAGRGAPDTGPYDDPLDVLRRQDHWLLPARSAVAAAADFITTHRGAVGAKARTRLSEAERHLESATEGTPKDPAEPAETAAPDAPAENTRHARRAHALAQEARHLAEQDVRAYGNPYGGPVGDGLAGALLGGIILGEPPDGAGRADLRGPACFGGTATRARRTSGGQF